METTPIIININSLVEKIVIVGNELTDEQSAQIEKQVISALLSAVQPVSNQNTGCPMSHRQFAVRMNQALLEEIQNSPILKNQEFPASQDQPSDAD